VCATRQLSEETVPAGYVDTERPLSRAVLVLVGRTVKHLDHTVHRSSFPHTKGMCYPYESTPAAHPRIQSRTTIKKSAC
jgi:hypothetical protein